MKITGGTVAFKVIVNKQEIDNVTNITIPDVELSTTELKGAGLMGGINIPSPCMVNPMTLSISFRSTGTDKAYLFSRGESNIEIRVASDTRLPSGKILTEGTKLFFSGYPTKLASGKVEMGTTRDETVDYSVYRFREIVDGVETILIDQINNKFKINGIDRADSIRSILG